MIIDLHTHTRPMSDDSYLEPAELIQRAKRNGLDAICLTEHDWFWNKDALSKLSREHDFLVLPGVEMNTEEGHMLVFGLEEYSFGMHRTLYLKQAVDGTMTSMRQLNGITRSRSSTCWTQLKCSMAGQPKGKTSSPRSYAAA